jgi:hypothetical protein
MMDLLRKIVFVPLNPNPLEFLSYLYPFSSTGNKQIHFQFFNRAHNSARFFHTKRCFFDIKIKFEPDKLASFCFFPLRALDHAFPVMIIAHW